MKRNTELHSGELQALRNAIESLNLVGYEVHQYGNRAKYFLTDNNKTSLTGEWDYIRLNHFIMGYGNAFNNHQSLKDENEKVKRLLHDLTPGGSEFYNDPERCYKTILEMRQSERNGFHKAMQKMKADVKPLSDALRIAYKAIIQNDAFLSQKEWKQIEEALNQTK